MMTTPAASLTGFRNGIREYGPDNETAIIWPRMDSKVQLLTPNTTVIYLFLWLDLKEGPMVMEAPPNVLGLIDDFWFRYVTDFGLAGPDKGKGGKYVILPPGYEGEVPAGHHVAQSQTYGNWLLIRGFLEDGDAGPGLQNIKDNFFLYPLGKTAADSKVKYHDISMKYLNTIHASDVSYFDEINRVVQEEPSDSQSPEILGLLASIGIEKGKPFEPDARMKKILEEAAAVGSAAARVVLYRNRDAEAKVYPDSGWEHPWIGGSHTFTRNGARLIDARTRFHMYATGITPAMVTPKVGSGTQYIAGMRDSEGRPLDGAKTYKCPARAGTCSSASTARNKPGSTRPGGRARSSWCSSGGRRVFSVDVRDGCRHRYPSNSREHLMRSNSRRILAMAALVAVILARPVWADGQAAFREEPLTQQSIQQFYDELDHQRAVQTYLWSIPAMYMYSLRQSLVETLPPSVPGRDIRCHAEQHTDLGRPDGQRDRHADAQQPGGLCLQLSGSED